jgi:hypothetical protein
MGPLWHAGCYNIYDVRRAAVVDCDGINKGVWDQLLQAAFTT